MGAIEGKPDRGDHCGNGSAGGALPAQQCLGPSSKAGPSRTFFLCSGKSHLGRFRPMYGDLPGPPNRDHRTRRRATSRKFTGHVHHNIAPFSKLSIQSRMPCATQSFEIRGAVVVNISTGLRRFPSHVADKENALSAWRPAFPSALSHLQSTG